ncbi:MAG: AlpA family phage regulatory protein [Pseudomonadota bacterium]|nr:AlpA family phage regulatory protein [Pseudomonadota bacterium]
MKKIMQSGSNQSAPDIAQERLIRLPELLTITSLSRASVYRLITNDKDFPKPVKLGNATARNSAVGFSLKEVQHWIETRAKQRGI